MKQCTCGRYGDHCPSCGSIQRWPLVKQSIIMTAEVREPVMAYRCKGCGKEYMLVGKHNPTLAFMNEGDLVRECKAPFTSKTPLQTSDPDDPQEIVDAVRLLEKKGFAIIDSKKLESLTSSAKELEEKKKLEEPLPEGFTRTSDGKIEAAFSIEDFLKKKLEE